MNNYELLTMFNEVNFPFAQIEIAEKSTKKKGLVSLNDNEIEVWYGNFDGGDDKIVSINSLNNDFIVTAINLIANCPSDN